MASTAISLLLGRQVRVPTRSSVTSNEACFRQFSNKVKGWFDKCFKMLDDFITTTIYNILQLGKLLLLSLKVLSRELVKGKS